MGAAVDRMVQVALKRTSAREHRLASSQAEGIVKLPASPVDRLTGDDAWTNYPRGMYQLLVEAEAIEAGGFDIAVTSNLLTGAGLSSSAALSLASGLALLGKAPTDPMTLVRLVQETEHRFAGVPVGILDPATSCYGADDQLVRIDCKSETVSTLPLPEGCSLWVFETGKKHRLVDSFYAQRRRECEEALSRLRQLYPHREYEVLADVPLAEFREVADELSSISRRRALHVLEEHNRVREIETVLAEKRLPEVGRLLVASHESSRTNFENSIPELDTLVELLIAQEGILGARLTGGGFGGAVMALADERFSEQRARAVSEQYSQRHKESAAYDRFRVGGGASICPNGT
jgi:galactokinase